MKVNTAVKVMVGAGLTAAMYQIVPQIKNMITNKTNNSSMSGMSGMSSMSSGTSGMSSSNGSKNSSL